MNKNVIGIIGAMDDEVNGLIEALSDVSVMKKASMDFYEGKYNNKKVIVVKCGVGKVNAAICAQILIDQYAVEAIINTGAAGSLDSKINIGDIVIGLSTIQHDMNAVDFGFPMGQVPFLPLEFKCDEGLCKEIEEGIEKLDFEVNVFKGLVVSGDEFVAKSESKDRIKSNFDALCTEMEGAAIAQTAYLNNVPVVVLRAISDKADDSASMDFPTFAKMASERNIKLLKLVL